MWGKALAKLPRILRHTYAFFIVVFGFVIFAVTDIHELGNYICSLFAFAGNKPIDTRFLWYLRNYGVVLAMACALAGPVYPWICQNIKRLGRRKRLLLSVVGGIGDVFLLLLSIAYLVNDTYNPFLYFRF